MKIFNFSLILLFFFPGITMAQSASLIPGALAIDGDVPPLIGHNIELRSDNLGNNFFAMAGGNNGSSYLNLRRGGGAFGAASATFGQFTTPSLTAYAQWNTGIGANIFSDASDYEIVLEGSSNLALSFFSPLSIDAQTLGTTLRNQSGHTLTLENGSNPATFLMKSFENGFGGTNDFAGFLWKPDGTGSTLSLMATSFDDTGVGPISMLSLLSRFSSNGNFQTVGDVIVNSIEIIDLGNSNLGVDADFLPSSGALGWDLGNNVPNESWDDVVADDFINVSDRRLKKEIRKLNYGLEEILQLNPVQYKYLKDLDEEKDHLGLIAQEVLDIIPEVVATHDVDADSTGQLVRKKNEYLGINYVSLVPVLVQSIQEQQAEIEELKAQKAALENRLVRLEQYLNLEPVEEEQTIVLTSTPQLMQNIPNPAMGLTQIGYFLPRSASSAQVQIFDQSGRLLQTTDLNALAGQHQVKVGLGQLPAGQYHYSLVVDGQLVDTKKMLVIE